MKKLLFYTTLFFLLTFSFCTQNPNGTYTYSNPGVTEFTINGDGFNNVTFSNAGIDPNLNIKCLSIAENGSNQTSITCSYLAASNGEVATLLLAAQGMEGAGDRYMTLGEIEIQVGLQTRSYWYTTDNWRPGGDTARINFSRFDPLGIHSTLNYYSSIVTGTFSATFRDNNRGDTVNITGKFSSWRAS